MNYELTQAQMTGIRSLILDKHKQSYYMFNDFEREYKKAKDAFNTLTDPVIHLSPGPSYRLEQLRAAFFNADLEPTFNEISSEDFLSFISQYIDVLESKSFIASQNVLGIDVFIFSFWMKHGYSPVTNITLSMGPAYLLETLKAYELMLVSRHKFKKIITKGDYYVISKNFPNKRVTKEWDGEIPKTFHSTANSHRADYNTGQYWPPSSSHTPSWKPSPPEEFHGDFSVVKTADDFDLLYFSEEDLLQPLSTGDFLASFVEIMVHENYEKYQTSASSAFMHGGGAVFGASRATTSGSVQKGANQQASKKKKKKSKKGAPASQPAGQPSNTTTKSYAVKPRFDVDTPRAQLITSFLHQLYQAHAERLKDVFDLSSLLNLYVHRYSNGKVNIYAMFAGAEDTKQNPLVFTCHHDIVNIKSHNIWDNTASCAQLLSAVSHLLATTEDDSVFPQPVIFAWFDEEESGMGGSRAFASLLKTQKMENPTGLINLELCGGGGHFWVESTDNQSSYLFKTAVRDLTSASYLSFSTPGNDAMALRSSGIDAICVGQMKRQAIRYGKSKGRFSTSQTPRIWNICHSNADSIETADIPSMDTMAIFIAEIASTCWQHVRSTYKKKPSATTYKHVSSNVTLPAVGAKKAPKVSVYTKNVHGYWEDDDDDLWEDHYSTQGDSSYYVVKPSDGKEPKASFDVVKYTKETYLSIVKEMDDFRLKTFLSCSSGKKEEVYESFDTIESLFVSGLDTVPFKYEVSVRMFMEKNKIENFMYPILSFGSSDLASDIERRHKTIVASLEKYLASYKNLCIKPHSSLRKEEESLFASINNALLMLWRRISSLERTAYLLDTEEWLESIGLTQDDLTFKEIFNSIHRPFPYAMQKIEHFSRIPEYDDVATDILSNPFSFVDGYDSPVITYKSFMSYIEAIFSYMKLIRLGTLPSSMKVQNGKLCKV